MEDLLGDDVSLSIWKSATLWGLMFAIESILIIWGCSKFSCIEGLCTTFLAIELAYPDTTAEGYLLPYLSLDFDLESEFWEWPLLANLVWILSVNIWTFWATEPAWLAVCMDCTSEALWCGLTLPALASLLLFLLGFETTTCSSYWSTIGGICWSMTSS